MARFLRRQVTYRLRPPPSSTFVASPPVAVDLAKQARRRLVTYKLGPPLAAPAATTFLARPLQVRLARVGKPPLVNAYLFPPEVIDPLAVTQYLQRKLARTPRQYRVTTSTLRAPATLVPAAAVFVARPLQSHVTQTRRRSVGQHFATPLPPPPVPPPFVARPLQVRFSNALKRGVERHFFTSALFPPEVVDGGAAVYFQGRLTRTPRQRYVTRYVLRKPVVLGVVAVVPPFRPLQTIFETATQRSGRRYRGRIRALSAPAVVTPFTPPPPPSGIPQEDPNHFILLHA